MVSRKDRKNVYILKNTPEEVEKSHKELQSKSVYLLKADDHVITRYSDTVYDFVDANGFFLLVTEDKSFFQYFRKAMYKEMRIDQERIHQIVSEDKATKTIQACKQKKLQPLVLLESVIGERSALPYLEELKANFKNLLVVVLMNDRDEHKIAQFVEAGADNIITKPVSVNMLIEKIANTILPPDALGKKIREGKMRLSKVEFALAYGVARDILEMKPGSPAGLLIMGDALKGLSKREDALKMYLQASENADMFLDPLKKIVAFYKEENDTENVLRYLLRIDELSPLHPERKKELGEIFFAKGEIQTAARYFGEAVKLMHEQKRKECVDLAKEYAERIFSKNENATLNLLTMLTRMARFYHIDAEFTWYNRLGMLQRRRKLLKEAIRSYTEAHNLSPKDGSVLFNLGMVYVETKDFGNAAQKFERAIKVQPSIYRDNIDAAYLMGQVFIKSNQTANAKAVLEHVQAVDSGYKKVNQLLDSLQNGKNGKNGKKKK